jgi:hypothetical protein
MDGDGSIYIAWFGSPSVLYKLSANLTVIAQAELPGAPISSPTILEEGIIVSAGSSVYLHRKSDLLEIDSWPQSGALNVLPYGNVLIAGANNDGFYIFNETSGSNPANNAPMLALYDNKIYGIDTVTYDVFESPDGSIVNKYPSGGAPFVEFIPSIFGNTLVALDGTDAQLLDLTTHQYTTIPIPSMSFSRAKFYKGGYLYYGSACPSVGSCLTEATTNTSYKALVDQEFIYSVNDDVLLTGGSESYQLTGLHLASKTIKLVFEAGAIVGKKRALASPLPPMIGDNCAVYYSYGEIYKLEPMPLQRVIPILECIDNTGRMYFGYRNLESNTVTIPRVHDRNNIAVLDNTPFKNFEPGRTVPYPASSIYLQAVNGVDTYTWVLEDYKLTFNKNNAALKCPTTFSLLITIKSSVPILPIHLRILERVISFVTGVSTGRIVIRPITKRSVMQDNTLEAELTVSPTNSTTSGEPSSQSIAETFVYEQASSVNAALSNDTDLPSSTEITNVSAKQLDNSVEGQQVVPPVASPTAPVSSTPQKPPQSTPIATSRAQRALSNLTSLLAVLLFLVVYAT